MFISELDGEHYPVTEYSVAEFTIPFFPRRLTHIKAVNLASSSGCRIGNFLATYSNPSTPASTTKPSEAAASTGARDGKDYSDRA